MAWRSVADICRQFLPRSTKRMRPSNSAQGNEQLPVKDPALPTELVKTWMWLPALIILLFLACLVMNVQYDMPVGESLLALFLAFFFSFLAIQSTGATGKCLLNAQKTFAYQFLRHHTLDCCVEGISGHPRHYDERPWLDSRKSSDPQPYWWSAREHWCRTGCW